MSYDFFGLQPLLIARIKAKVTGVTSVLSGMNQEAMLNLSQVVPAIYVLYSNYALVEQVEREALISQTWLVTIVLESDRVADVKTTAGPLLGNILEALVGWQPNQDYGVLILASAPPMTFQPAIAQQQPALADSRVGLWHIPLAFSSQLYVTGNIP